MEVQSRDSSRKRKVGLSLVRLLCCLQGGESAGLTETKLPNEEKHRHHDLKASKSIQKTCALYKWLNNICRINIFPCQHVLSLRSSPHTPWPKLRSMPCHTIPIAGRGSHSLTPSSQTLSAKFRQYHLRHASVTGRSLTWRHQATRQTHIT